VQAIDGEEIDSATALRDAIQQADGAEVTLTIERDGDEKAVAVTPEKSTDAAGEEVWLIGIALTTDYDFPIDVRLQLDNVGGPSAGMMFALGIIDELTPGELNG